MSLVVKNPLTSAGDVGDRGLIPGLGRSPEGGKATHPSIIAWKIPWTEEPGRLQSMGWQRVRHERATEHTHIIQVTGTLCIAQETLL